MADVLISQYAIYERPADYPESFVVRRWDVVDGVGVAVPCGNPLLAKSLEQARRAIPAGFVNIGRWPEDDPTIAEVWI